MLNIIKNNYWGEVQFLYYNTIARKYYILILLAFGNYNKYLCST